MPECQQMDHSWFSATDWQSAHFENVFRGRTTQGFFFRISVIETHQVRVIVFTEAFHVRIQLGQQAFLLIVISGVPLGAQQSLFKDVVA